MNESSVSAAEFTVMSLRNAPDAVVVGSPSLGADGDVVQFKLPGDVATRFSGLSIFYPDGSPTQRVGIQPDITCLPTIAGIAAGKDELLDKAISLIVNP